MEALISRYEKENDTILSDNEIARRTGLEQVTVSRVHNGYTKNPTTATLAPLATLFGVSLSVMRGEACAP